MAKERVIPFKVEYYDITGNHLSALVLVQLEYWQPKAFNGWISKTESEWKQELRVSYKMLQRVQADLVNLGFIQVKQAMYKDRKTTHYKVNLEAVKEAIYALNPNSVLTKGQLDERSTLPKVDITKGQPIDLPKVNSSIDERSVLYTESITESITENKKTETSSVVPDGLFKSDKLKELAEQAISKNEQAKPKSKKPKEPTDPLTAEIHKYVCESYDYLKKWHDDKYESPMLSYDKDFKNLKGTFRKLIEGSSNFAEAKRVTPEKCFNGVKYFVDNFDKLDSFHQRKFSLNYIATNWDELKKSIQAYQAPVPKQNLNEPIKYVHKRLPEYYNGYTLPFGITAMQFEKLARFVYREKVIEGEIDENIFTVSTFYDPFRNELHKLTEEQINQLLKDYEL
jgi:hypothetical protein